MLIKNTILSVSITVTLCLSISGCENKDDWEEIAYRVGDYEHILKRSDSNSLYRGMLYEYGIGVEADITKARQIYARHPNRKVSNKRLFHLCFIHCESELGAIYGSIKNDFSDVDFLFSVYLLSGGNRCDEMVGGDMCRLATKSFDYIQSQDPYYFLGLPMYKRIIKKAKGFTHYEMPHYLMLKSASLGNSEAQTFLDELPNSISWVPKP